MILTASHIANFFLLKENHNISNLKLNKLIYISLGYSLALLNRNLFDEGSRSLEIWPSNTIYIL